LFNNATSCKIRKTDTPQPRFRCHGFRYRSSVLWNHFHTDIGKHFTQSKKLQPVLCIVCITLKVPCSKPIRLPARKYKQAQENWQARQSMWETM
jgi:hypothetical protein